MATFWLTRKFINRNFVLLWAGQFISVLGDWIFNTTLILWISSLTSNKSWGPLAVSGLLVATYLPSFIIGPLVGVWVDRWDKKKIMLWADALRALFLLFFILTSNAISLSLSSQDNIMQRISLGAIYIFIFVIAICGQFFSPAYLVLINDIVPQDDQVRANGLLQISPSLAVIVGPSVGAVLVFSVGIQWSLIINAFSFIVSFCALWLIHVPPVETNSVSEQQRKGFFLEFGEGVQLVLRNRILRTILVVMFLVLLDGGTGEALNIFFVKQNLHAPPILYGILGTSAGIGILIGSFLIGRISKILGTFPTFGIGVIFMGVLSIIYARQTNMFVAVLVQFLLGMCNAVLNVTLIPLMLLITPRSFLGRVKSLLSPIMTTAMLLSITLSGYIASTLLQNMHVELLGITFGPIDTIFTISGFFTLLGGIYAMIVISTQNTDTK